MNLRALALAAVGLPLFCFANLQPGDALPAFSEKALDGKDWTNADTKGKYVVLEWTNYGCPFVKKHYDSGNMQSLQKELTGKDVVWLTVCSAAPGKGGQLPADEFKKQAETQKSAGTAILLDTDGTLGKACGAKTTPHMMLISPEGKVIYNGALDDKPSTKADEAAGNNYVKAALEAALAGKPVATPATKPYGCGIKYP